MTNIGILSDTHGYVDDRVFEYFRDCDEIWHAGDIGNLTLAMRFETAKIFRAVYGNIDDKEVQLRYPENLIFNCEDLKILITHIAGSPPKYNPRVKKLIKEVIPDVFVCGHSHILRIKRDPQYNNMLFVNPGAAGNQGFHSIKTIVRFKIDGKRIEQVEAIELGKRGAL